MLIVDCRITTKANLLLIRLLCIRLVWLLNRRIKAAYLWEPVSCVSSGQMALGGEKKAKAYLIRWRFGLVGNVVGRINEDNQRWARLVLGWVTIFKKGKPSLYVTSHPGQLSLAIPLRVGKMSTGDDYGHCQGRNVEFCVTVGPVTRAADILTQSVIWRTWAVC